MRVGGSGTYHKPLRWYKMALTKSQTQEAFLLVCNNNLSTYKEALFAVISDATIRPPSKNKIFNLVGFTRGIHVYQNT